MRIPALTLAIGLTAALVAGATAPADAGFRRLRTSYTPGEVITAYSRFGNGAVSGQVRPARYGWEVRLPRGSWVGCRRSCEETLRVQTVDIFGDGDNSLSGGGYGSLQRECGILGCLGIGFSY